MQGLSHVVYRYRNVPYYSKRRAIKPRESGRSAGMYVCGSLYREGGHCGIGKAEEPQIEKLGDFSQDCYRFSSGSNQPKNRTERQPSRNLFNLIGTVLRDESSPVAQFGAAALSILGSSSSAREGEVAS